MANWSLPTLTDLYTNFRQYLSDRLDDAAKMFDSATTTPTNQPVGTKRWNSTSNKFEKWSGSAWSDLAPTYGISISGNAATATTAGTAGSVTTVTSANITSGLGYTPLNKAGGTVTGELTVSGLVTGGAGLTITGDMYASGSIHTSGTAQFDTTLGVNGAVTVGGPINCWGGVSANNASLRANGWGGVATDGIVHFGSADAFIHKHGSVFNFWIADILSAEITKGGTVAMTSDIPAAGVSKDQGSANIGSYCLCKTPVGGERTYPDGMVSGGTLYPSNADGLASSALSGTWRCCGYHSSSNDVTLYQRIA